MLNETQSYHPVPGRSFQTSHRFFGRSHMSLSVMRSVVILLGLMGMTSSAAAHPEFQVGAIQAEPAGIECITRSVPRKIAPKHFVLDRITYCAPIVRLAATGPEKMDEKMESVVEDQSIGLEAVAALTKPIAGPTAEPTADELPDWSPTRDRLSNRQYARSLRELGRGVRRTSR